MSTSHGYGILRIQVKGPKKWTSLRNFGWPWGIGYDDTCEQARAKAEKQLSEIQAAKPSKQYRIN